MTLDAVAPGIAIFQADPADDLVSETVVLGSDEALDVNELRLGRSTLTIRDATGNFPSAVDDSFPLTLDGAGNQVTAVDSAGNPITSNTADSNVLDVLANDNFGPTGTLNEFNIEILPQNGTVSIDDGGTPGDLTDDTVEYTADLGFNGFDSFVYSIVSGDGVRSTAEVTLNVGTVDPNDLLVEMSFEFVDESGDPITQASVGDTVGLRVDMDDLRETFGDETFVFAGFLDILYEADLLAPNLDPSGRLGFEVEFGENIDPDAASGFVDRVGIIDEFGSSDARSDNPQGEGPDPRELATIFFTAEAAGEATVVGSPADFFPFRDTLLFGRDTAVPVESIVYDRASLTVTSGGAGEGEQPRQNLTFPQDVNNDGYASAIDALIVINTLSRVGYGGEGESAPLSNKFFTDVNGDGRVSAIDALGVINHLSSDRSSGNGGEGEAAVATADSQTGGNDPSTDDATDAVFADLGDSSLAQTTPVAGSSEGEAGVAVAAPTVVSSGDEDSDDEDDDVLNLLADDVGQLWA